MGLAVGALGVGLGVGAGVGAFVGAGVGFGVGLRVGAGAAAIHTRASAYQHGRAQRVSKQLIKHSLEEGPNITPRPRVGQGDGRPDMRA